MTIPDDIASATPATSASTAYPRTLSQQWYLRSRNARYELGYWFEPGAQFQTPSGRQTLSTWIAIVISALALAVSALTAWFTFMRKGDLRMTQPTVVFLGPDGGRRDGQDARLKVFLRTLLYSTSPRGQTVESMHVNVQRGESKQNFSIWVYGDERLARGSGIFVGPEGVACNHHFLLPEDGTTFRLLPGRYSVGVYGKRVSDREPHELTRLALTISEAEQQQLEADDAGIYFDWGPDQQEYHSHVEIRKPNPLPPWLLDAAG